MHDPLLGRFTSVDPLASDYVHNSTYAFAENRVPSGIDLEGLEYAPPLKPGTRPGFVPDGAAYVAQAKANIEVVKASDVNDATVLATAFTRGGNAINVDGTPASSSDIGFAAAGAFLPVVSGSALNNFSDVVLEGFEKLAKRFDTFAKNKRIGKLGEIRATGNLQTEFSSDNILNQVTGKFADGNTVIFDNIVIDAKTGKVKLINETKTGNASLSDAQKRFFEKGESATLIGPNAESVAGTTVDSRGFSTRITRFTRDELE